MGCLLNFLGDCNLGRGSVTWGEGGLTLIGNYGLQSNTDSISILLLIIMVSMCNIFQSNVSLSKIISVMFFSGKRWYDVKLANDKYI